MYLRFTGNLPTEDPHQADVNCASPQCNGDDNRDREDILHRLAVTSALFILGLKEQHRLTQVATQAIIEGVTNLMQVSLQRVQCYYRYAIGIVM